FVHFEKVEPSGSPSGAIHGFKCMTPEVSGLDITEGDAYQEWFPKLLMWKTVNIKAKAGKPFPRPSGSGIPPPGDAQEQLQLLWSLWQAQGALRQEEELLQQAAAVQEELAKQCHCLRLELHKAEAELESSASRSDNVVEEELQRAEREHEELQQALHQAERQLHAQDQEDAAVSEKAELKRLRLLRQTRAQAQTERREELREQLLREEARGRDERWALREELTEACVATELLSSEVSAERKARDATLQRLREEEMYLVGQVSEAEEADHASRSSIWSVHSESAWSEVALSRPLEPFDISTPREVSGSDSPAALSDTTAGASSLLQELRGSRRGRTRASLAGYQRSPDGWAAKPMSQRLRKSRMSVSVASFRPLEKAKSEGSDRSDAATRRLRSSVANFRPLRADPTSGLRLSVIGEEATEVVTSLGLSPAKPLASLGEALRKDLPDTSSSEDGSEAADRRRAGELEFLNRELFDRCRGVLEWTLSEEVDSPRWAGPCLFLVERLTNGRRVFRLSKLFSESGAEELDIPLLAISAVREHKQDPLGMIFLVRYKAMGERVQVLFRAATREGRSTWVANLCEAIHTARGEAPRR
ncbi:unnamed protein product, partial [Effrenium voratum]